MKVYISNCKEDLLDDIDSFTPFETVLSDPEYAAEEASKDFAISESESFEELYAICVADDGTETRVTVIGEPSWEYSGHEGWDE